MVYPQFITKRLITQTFAKARLFDKIFLEGVYDVCHIQGISRKTVYIHKIFDWNSKELRSLPNR